VFFALEKPEALWLSFPISHSVPYRGEGMPKPVSKAEFSIEDLFAPSSKMPCGEGGIVGFPQHLEFKAPPVSSPFAGRLVLATAKQGSIKVQVDLKNHKVRLNVSKSGNEKELLIRLPIGVRLFKVTVSDGYFFYYETAEGYNVIPFYVKKGTDPGQKMQELILVVSPVPPRDASQATQPFTIEELTLEELNTRRAQDGLPAISK
jgi:hypothetical protein